MKAENNYRLYIGFRMLGEFHSIHKAKLFARDCRLAGISNLIGIIIGIVGMYPKLKLN